MPLFRFRRPVSYVNAYGAIVGGSRFDPRRIEAGEVREEMPVIGLGVYPEDIELLPKPGDEGPPTTIADIVLGLERLLVWICACHLQDNYSLVRRIVTARVRELVEAYVMMEDTPPLSFDSTCLDSASSVSSLVNLVKGLRREIGAIGNAHAEVAERATEPGAPGRRHRSRGRPRGSPTAARDLKLYHDWRSAHGATKITRKEFLRERGLPERDLAAIERGRAQEKRRS
jgi:hypothetical protein